MLLSGGPVDACPDDGRAEVAVDAPVTGQGLHDVQAVAGHPEREALSDPDVLALARSERRAVVTNNIRDFRPLHVEAVLPGGPGHYGMIFMPGTYRRTKNDIGHLVAALEAKLGQYPGEEDLVNAEEWL